jgi:predicted glycosyl hydrolase (DUF1957 family)
MHIARNAHSIVGIIIQTKTMEEAAFALNALNRQNDDKRRKFIAKEFRDSMLCKASTWLNKAKKTNGER